VIPAGQVSNDLIDFTDVLPSLLELAGATQREGLDGRSFIPLLKGLPGNPREWFFTYYNPRPERTKPVRFTRDQRWKLYGDGRFFDVHNDSLEEHPISAASTPEAVAAKTKLEKALAQMPAEGQTLLRFAP
jgi:arylsulfatase A